jgi:predicted dehydrogenase
MSRRPHRLAIAGCGTAAFGIHLPLLTARPDFEVTAVCDRDPARAATAARRFGVPAATMEELLRDADMLVVLTGFHDDLIAAGLAAGRHVFTEKPVTTDPARTRALRQQAEAAGLLLEAGAMRACDPALHALLAAVPDPSGGWLVKADGADEAARRRTLPAGFDPYTFAADPPPAVPAGLDSRQAAALTTLLWEGYHLLTVLAIAVPGATAATCAIDDATRAVHATVTSPAGHLYSLMISRPPDGTFAEQARLTGTGTSATLDFPPPYSGQPATLTTAGATATGFADPFTRMWNQVSARLSDGTTGTSPSMILAGQVEELALGLARAAVPAARQGAGHA